MKKILLTFILAVSFSVYAGNPTDNNTVVKKNATEIPNNTNKKISVGLSVGISVPIQAYGSKSTSTDTAHINGYAKAGFHYNVTFGYKFSKYVGGMLMVGGSINGVGSSASSTGGLFSFTPTISSSQPYYIGQYLIGPYLTSPLGKNLSLEVRALVGLVSSSYPKITESSSFSFGTYSFGGSRDTKLKSSVGFGYSFGLGAKYMLSEHLGVTLNVAYTGSSMVYTQSTSTISIAGVAPYTYTSDSHKQMSIGMINITGGLAYSF